MSCTTCFDQHLTARLLAERCSVEMSLIESVKAIVTYTCPHGRRHRHAVYPGSADWVWCEIITNNWQACQPADQPSKAA
jgi:hypothetical protein